MGRTLRAILAIIFIAAITVSCLSICQNVAKTLKIDITNQKIYSLSDGTKSIISKLNQPIKMKLYYTRTMATKAPDQIRYFNNYYHFVQSLLEEYVAAANGMIELEIIDPKPFTDDETDAIRYGLRRIPVTEEESFMFGLALQTQFGVTKSIPLFSPERQSFVEYDISYLIDTAIRRQRKKIGVISSMPVMGEKITPYMAQMMQMQKQQPKAPWTIITQLRSKYEVLEIPEEVQEINDVDILLIIHPKIMFEKTLFAIDQFILKGGPVVVLLDPYCVADKPRPKKNVIAAPPDQSSNLEPLLSAWGLKMPTDTYAADSDMAIVASLGGNRRLQKIISFLAVNPKGFNQDSAITAQLNEVRMLFAGVLNKTNIAHSNDIKIDYTPLVSTTAKGNSIVANPYELTVQNPRDLIARFTEGNQPVRMGYLITGQLPSAFPSGLQKKTGDPNAAPAKTHLTKSADQSTIAIFSDVDFISDAVAYSNSFFGKIALVDNAAILLNTLDELAGSSDLISIRSRGNFSRPFIAVDRIEAQAQQETIEQEKKINAEIAGFKSELARIVATAKQDQKSVIGSSIFLKKKQLELKLHTAQTKLRQVKMHKRRRIELLGNKLRNLNTLPGPALILIIAVVLISARTIKKRHYVSHTTEN